MSAMPYEQLTPSGAATPDAGTTTPTTASRKKRYEAELTDQTNLLPFKKVVVVFASLSVCILVTTLDSTISATALPTISKAFDAGSVSSWVPSAYLLTSTAFQPLCESHISVPRYQCSDAEMLDVRFSDIFGRKATICLAMAIFMIGSLLAGLSHSIIQLIICRGVAGAGGGGIVSIVQIVMADVVSLRERCVETNVYYRQASDACVFAGESIRALLEESLRLVSPSDLSLVVRCLRRFLGEYVGVVISVPIQQLMKGF